MDLTADLPVAAFSLDQHQWVAAWAAVMDAASETPSWLAALHATQWAVAVAAFGGGGGEGECAAADEATLTKDAFLAWRAALDDVPPVSGAGAGCGERCDVGAVMRRWGGIGAAKESATTEEEGWAAVFDAAVGPDGRLGAPGWALVVRRFYASSNQWCPLNGVAL